MSRVAAPSWTFVGLGGNLGSSEELRSRFLHAIAAIAALPYVTRVEQSSLYRTAPLGPVANQPAFLNQVIAFPAHERAPVEVLRDLLALEAELGRDRVNAEPKGPRAIDLDLLLVGNQVVDDAGPPALVLPHPAMTERRFVLEPLVELVGAELLVPGLGVDIGALLRGVRRQVVQRAEPS
jgi:2-amino-4-hydroxy-6-hydroxymethyldihydropteridine diphosphokinase